MPHPLAHPPARTAAGHADDPAGTPRRRTDDPPGARAAACLLRVIGAPVLAGMVLLLLRWERDTVLRDPVLLLCALLALVVAPLLAWHLVCMCAAHLATARVLPRMLARLLVHFVERVGTRQARRVLAGRSAAIVLGTGIALSSAPSVLAVPVHGPPSAVTSPALRLHDPGGRATKPAGPVGLVGPVGPAGPAVPTEPAESADSAESSPADEQVLPEDLTWGSPPLPAHPTPVPTSTPAPTPSTSPSGRQERPAGPVPDTSPSRPGQGGRGQATDREGQDGTHGSGGTRQRGRAGSTAPTTHVVSPGESLWSIATDHLGAGADAARVAQLWPRIHAANETAIGEDPDLIHPGTHLTIPGDQ